jgi:uncharacterized protein
MLTSRHVRGVLLGLVVALLLAAPAAAQTFPALGGRVVDDAGILDASTRATLDANLADLEAQTTDQLVVVTLKSLQGLTIEDYGVRLGRQWQIGQKTKNNGVLLIVAPSDRKVRIEVGYGLEAELTDAVASFIIQQSILPRFKANDMPDGIVRGVDDIIRVLTGDAAEWQHRAARAQPSLIMRALRMMFGVLSWIPEDFLVILVIFVFSAMLSLMSLLWLRLLAPVFIHVGVALGLMSPDSLRALALRQAKWHFLGGLDMSGTSSSHASHSSSSSSWSSSSSGSSFSGGGGSFGGGGSSGSW